jgi:hypothetical protein
LVRPVRMDGSERRGTSGSWVWGGVTIETAVGEATLLLLVPVLYSAGRDATYRVLAPLLGACSRTHGTLCDSSERGAPWGRCLHPELDPDLAAAGRAIARAVGALPKPVRAPDIVLCVVRTAAVSPRHHAPTHTRRAASQKRALDAVGQDV